MPFLIILVVVLALAVLSVLLLPVSLVLRFRAGKARRPARRWAALLNVASLAVSIGLALAAAAITSWWLPGALRYTLAGLGLGVLLGLAGVALTRWEVTPRGLYFTPNAWLVLLVTLVVSARLAYGAWHTWEAWRAGLDHASWMAASGVRGSLGAGGLVLGFFFSCWMGVLWQIRRLTRR